MIASAAFGAVSAFILDYMGLRAGVSEIFYGLKIWPVKEDPTLFGIPRTDQSIIPSG